MGNLRITGNLNIDGSNNWAGGGTTLNRNNI